MFNFMANDANSQPTGFEKHVLLESSGARQLHFVEWKTRCVADACMWMSKATWTSFLFAVVEHKRS